MTTAQKTLTETTLKELQTLAPNVEWHVTWNYYTKLPEFKAIGSRGGVEYDMFKRERQELVIQDNGIKYHRYTGEKYTEMSATVDKTTRVSATGMIVSGAHSVFALPQAQIKEEIPRVDFKKYVDFVKRNLALTEDVA